MAEEKRSVEGVSAAVWERMRAVGVRDHGTVFENGEEPRGTATTRTPVGPVVLRFEFDADAERITYTILRKPLFAASGLIWGGIGATLARCRDA